MRTNPIDSLGRQVRQFLAPLIPHIGRTERHRGCLNYTLGLLGEGARKSVQPMAERMQIPRQNLNLFLNRSPWDWEKLQQQLAIRMCRVTSPKERFWIVDETSFVKAGSKSVGVAHQYCGALGKQANCQVAVSLHMCQDAESFPVGWELFLPESWTLDAPRRKQAGIPAGVEHQNKQALGLMLIDQALAAGLPQGCVLADILYGQTYSFRKGLRTRGLSYALAVDARTLLNLLRPDSHPPLCSALTLARTLSADAWRTLTWRQGTKKPQRSRFAMTEVWAAHRPAAGEIIGPRVVEQLLIEWPLDQARPTGYWMLWHPTRWFSRVTAVRCAHGRWRVEQDYRELKEEIGLDHYEGRGWLGWHHHVTLVTLAFCFLRWRQRKKKRTAPLLASHSSPAAMDADSHDGSVPAMSDPLYLWAAEPDAALPPLPPL
jgi:SRSO17 transposase